VRQVTVIPLCSRCSLRRRRWNAGRRQQRSRFASFCRRRQLRRSANRPARDPSAGAWWLGPACTEHPVSDSSRFECCSKLMTMKELSVLAVDALPKALGAVLSYHFHVSRRTGTSTCSWPVSTIHARQSGATPETFSGTPARAGKFDSVIRVTSDLRPSRTVCSTFTSCRVAPLVVQTASGPQACCLHLCESLQLQ